MSAYQTRFVALEIFYLGASYHGFASQGDTGPTVEVTSESYCRNSTAFGLMTLLYILSRLLVGEHTM